MSPQSEPRRIVVGVDESDGAAEALRWAVREAEFDGAQLTAVMSWDFLDQHRLLEGEKWDPAYDESQADAALARFVEMAVGSDAVDRVERRVIVDLPASALVQASADADLVVVGARGLGGFRGLLLGSVSQQVLHHATVPVAIIRAETAREQSGRIVVGIDGSGTADGALRWAIDEARRRSATLDVVHVWLPALGLTPLGRERLEESLGKDSDRLIADALARQDASGVRINPVSLRSATVAGMVDTAGGADLLAVGTHGRGTFKRTVIGSVATQLSHHAPCPLVVVPQPAT
jgi:nucleotide-binding universal stress UspA family protein